MDQDPRWGLPENGEMVDRCGLTPQIARNKQTLHYPAIFEMRLDDFVNILGVNKAVPNCFRVHHGYRSRCTAVEAA